MTNRSSIEVIIPHSVFTALSAFQTVFISIPGYSSNSNAVLSMRIDLYDQQGYFDSAISTLSTISLNELMLAKTGFTVLTIHLNIIIFLILNFGIIIILIMK